MMMSGTGSWMTNDAVRLRPWVAIVALLAAPVGSAIVSSLLWDAILLLEGYRPAISLQADAYSIVIFALPFFVVGAPLIVVFWKRAPFNAIPCSVFGVGCGALVSGAGMGLLDANNYAWLGSYWKTLMVAMGSVAGLGGGLIFWLICRAGSRRSAR